MHIRPLTSAEWPLYRDFRLQALRSAPGVFATAHADAASRAEDDWREPLANPGKRIFGLFDDKKLIGLTAAFTSADEPDTALLAMSFILPEYRGRGLSRRLFEARLDWIRSRRFRRVVVMHRVSNIASERAIRAFGFQPTGRQSRTWPDGTVEDEIQYELQLV